MRTLTLEKARYEIGEISKQTGKKKVAEGVWVFPGKEKGAKKEGEPKKIKPRKNGPPSKDIGKGEYSIQSKGGHVKVPGKQVKIDPNHHTFAFKQGGQVKIADADTGKVISQGEDAKDAMNSAKMMLSHPEYDKSKKEHIEKKGVSPGFQKSPEEEKVSGELEKQKSANEKLTSQVSEMQGQMKKMESMIKQMQSGVKAGEKVGGTVAKPDVQKIADISLEIGEKIGSSVSKKEKKQLKNVLNKISDEYEDDAINVSRYAKSERSITKGEKGNYIKVSDDGGGLYVHKNDIDKIAEEFREKSEGEKAYKNNKKRSELVDSIRESFEDDDEIIENENVIRLKDIGEDEDESDFLQISNEGEGYFVHKDDIDKLPGNEKWSEKAKKIFPTGNLQKSKNIGSRLFNSIKGILSRPEPDSSPLEKSQYMENLDDESILLKSIDEEIDSFQKL